VVDDQSVEAVLMSSPSSSGVRGPNLKGDSSLKSAGKNMLTVGFVDALRRAEEGDHVHQGEEVVAQEIELLGVVVRKARGSQ